jgi:hypothetical protein
MKTRNSEIYKIYSGLRTSAEREREFGMQKPSPPRKIVTSLFVTGK